MGQPLIGIDAGGTSVRVGFFADADSDRIERTERFEVSGDYAEDFKRLVGAVESVRGKETLGGIGIGVAGEFDDGRDRLVQSPHLKGWVGKPLREDVAKAFDCRVALVNDAEAGAWAEAHFGKHEADFWFITWGTGIGGSIVEQRSEGLHVTAAEPGHSVIRWDESSPICNCGKHGCFEAYVGGASIGRRFGKPAAELSEAEWDDVTDWMARGLYDIVRTRPVRKVVLGGGIMVKQSQHLPEIQQKLDELMAGIHSVALAAATHGEEAGMVGARAVLNLSD